MSDPKPKPIYHVNPDTGNANICRATKRKCDFGIEVEHHYETKIDAVKGAEIDLKGQYLTQNEALAIIADIERSGMRVEDDGMDFDGVKYNFEYIKAVMENFNQMQTRGFLGDLVRAGQIAEILDKDNPTDKDFKKAEHLFKHMKDHPHKNQYTKKSNFTNPENRIYAFAEGLIAARKLETIPEPPLAPERPEVEGFSGLREAQLMSVRTANMHDSLGDSAINYFDKSMNRLMSGEEVPYDPEVPNSPYTKPKHDRLITYMAHESQTHLATIWPEQELAPALKKNGVTSKVEVNTFYNNREWGNVYTVAKPNGDSISFSVYEHRNTDAIIINGKTNWDGEERPYVKDSKDEFFAEISGDERAKAADVLAFYMREAETGQLKDDDELAASAMRLDWNAILSEQIPGFGDWARKNGYAKHDTDTEDGILDNLDF